MDVITIIAALGGGMFGAAYGALPAFVFTGVLVLIGVATAAAGGGTTILDTVAFGPVFGPHISFGGGAAAAAYAAKRGYVENGKDIARGLLGLKRPDVLWVGGVFGFLGLGLNEMWIRFGMAPWTDSIALSVVVSAIVARLAFGSTGVFGRPAPDGPGRFRTTETHNWVPFQESFGQILAFALAAGIVSSWAALQLGADRGGGAVGFGFAAAMLVFLQFGATTGVCHHIALPAAAAALATGSLYWGAAFGVIGGLLGEGMSRLFQIHGDTHIDPPAAAIAAAILLVRLIESYGLAG